MYNDVIGIIFEFLGDGHYFFVAINKYWRDMYARKFPRTTYYTNIRTPEQLESGSFYSWEKRTLLGRTKRNISVELFKYMEENRWNGIYESKLVDMFAKCGNVPIIDYLLNTKRVAVNKSSTDLIKCVVDNDDVDMLKFLIRNYFFITVHITTRDLMPHHGTKILKFYVEEMCCGYISSSAKKSIFESLILKSNLEGLIYVLPHLRNKNGAIPQRLINAANELLSSRLIRPKGAAKMLEFLHFNAIEITRGRLNNYIYDGRVIELFIRIFGEMPRLDRHIRCGFRALARIYPLFPGSFGRYSPVYEYCGAKKLLLLKKAGFPLNENTLLSVAADAGSIGDINIWRKLIDNFDIKIKARIFNSLVMPINNFRWIRCVGAPRSGWERYLLDAMKYSTIEHVSDIVRECPYDLKIEKLLMDAGTKYLHDRGYRSMLSSVMELINKRFSQVFYFTDRMYSFEFFGQNIANVGINLEIIAKMLKLNPISFQIRNFLIREIFMGRPCNFSKVMISMGGQ